MSGYDDYDYDDDDDYEWFYVADEYMTADDLAQHAVPSPPPTAFDDDMQGDWDRYDYFNDLEYASDGYDDANFQPHDAKNPDMAQRRRRMAKITRSIKKKKQKMLESVEPTHPVSTTYSPVVWRSQSDRAPKQNVLTGTPQSYALLKDWREELPDTPKWALGSLRVKPPDATSKEAHQALASPTSGLVEEDEEASAENEETDEDRDIEISQDALMASLQKQLAAAGGPLSGMDPQQVVQFAIRMMAGNETGEDIAGEMVDTMLGDEEEDDDAATEEHLLSWVAQQRNANKGAVATEPRSSEAARDGKQPPTPSSSSSSSEATSRVKLEECGHKSGGAKSNTWTAQSTKPVTSSKRKAEDEEENSGSERTTKKRAMKSIID